MINNLSFIQDLNKIFPIGNNSGFNVNSFASPQQPNIFGCSYNNNPYGTNNSYGNNLGGSLPGFAGFPSFPGFPCQQPNISSLGFMHMIMGMLSTFLPYLCGNEPAEKPAEPNQPDPSDIQKKYDQDGNLLWKIIDNNDGTKDVTWYNDDGSIKQTANRVTNDDGTTTDFLKDADGNSIGKSIWGNGVSKRYDENNNIQWKIINNDNGTQDVTWYNEDGNVKQTANRVKNDDGTTTDFLKDADGNEIGSKTWGNGIVKRCDADGNIQWKIIDNTDGSKNVNWYNEDGSIKHSAHRVKNNDGSTTDFLRNDKGEFIGSKTWGNGESKKYDENGNLQWKIINNDNGTQDVTWYNEDGNVKQTANRVKNDDGTTTDFLKDADGNDIGKTTWGNCVSKKYNADGDLLHKVVDNNDNSKAVTWYNEDGSVKQTSNRVFKEDGSIVDHLKDPQGNAIGINKYDENWKKEWTIKNNEDGSQDVKWYNEDGSIKKTSNRVKNDDGTTTDFLKDADGNDIGKTTWGNGVSARYNKDGDILWQVINNNDGTKAVTWYDEDGNVRLTSHRVHNNDGTIMDFLRSPDGEYLGYKKYDENWKLILSTVA